MNLVAMTWQQRSAAPFACRKISSWQTYMAGLVVLGDPTARLCGPYLCESATSMPSGHSTVIHGRWRGLENGPEFITSIIWYCGRALQMGGGSFEVVWFLAHAILGPTKKPHQRYGQGENYHAVASYFLKLLPPTPRRPYARSLPFSTPALPWRSP